MGAASTGKRSLIHPNVGIHSLFPKGMAGLVQAGYLASSVLCIGLCFFEHPNHFNESVVFRFSDWACFPSHRTAR